MLSALTSFPTTDSLDLILVASSGISERKKEERERRLVVVMDLINLGPECHSLKAVGQKVRRICPLWTYHPKSLGCTSPLMLLSQ